MGDGEGRNNFNFHFWWTEKLPHTHRRAVRTRSFERQLGEREWMGMGVWVKDQEREEPPCGMALALTRGEGKQGRWVVNVSIQQCREG